MSLSARLFIGKKKILAELNEIISLLKLGFERGPELARLNKMFYQLLDDENKELETPITDWLIYNSFNYILNHLDYKFAEETKLFLDREIFKTINSIH